MAKKGRRKKKTIDINVAVVILVIISVLLFVLIYTKSGYIGEHLSPMLGGIMGFIKYIKTDYEYYSSGHQYLHGVNSVMDNVDNFIEMKSDLNYAYNNNLTVAANGSSYDKTKDGVIPQAMTMLFNYRKEIKTEMKKVKQKWQDKIKELNELEKRD